MIELLTSPEAWVSLTTLTVLEVILGIDNVVFISVLVSRLPKAQARIARQIGLALALVARIILLFLLAWIIGLTKPLFNAFGIGFSWRDMILIFGGLFLIFKATMELHHAVEGDGSGGKGAAQAGFAIIIMQIVVIDIVFSLDSIITAIGIAEHIEIMVTAIVIAMIVMYIMAEQIAKFIDEHPTTKVLALAFLVVIGLALLADGLHQHIPRGYIYFSLAFAGMVETINILRSNAKKKLSAKNQNDISTE